MKEKIEEEIEKIITTPEKFRDLIFRENASLIAMGEREELEYVSSDYRVICQYHSIYGAEKGIPGATKELPNDQSNQSKTS